MSAASEARLEAAGASATIGTAAGRLCVTSLRLRGEELLALPASLPETYRVHGALAGMPLLHPWANRLGSDRWSSCGVPAVAAGDDPTVHRDVNGLPIHGLPMPGGWALEVTGTRSLRAQGRFTGHPAFPHPHDLEVDLVLGSRTLTVTTAVRAPAAPVPVALGWHPYLAVGRRAAAILELPEHRRLLLDERGLPIGARRAAANRLPLEDRHLDEAMSGLAPGAVLAVEDGSRRTAVVLERGFAHAQVFAPADAAIVCLEPMTASCDGLRRGDARLATSDRPHVSRFRVEVGVARADC